MKWEQEEKYEREVVYREEDGNKRGYGIYVS